MTDTSGAPVLDPFHVWLGLDAKEENIPYSLQVVDQWVLWKAEPKTNGVGMDKVPYQTNGVKASSTDPATWTDFRSAVSALYDEGCEYSGIGFVLRSTNDIVGLDFDHVRNAHTGEIDEVALGAIRYLDTYAEVSPSGTGVRVIGYGSIGHAISGASLQGWEAGRYVTITGHRLAGVPEDLKAFDPAKLEEVRGWFSKPKPAQTASGPSGYVLDTRQVLEIRNALGYVDPDETYDIWIQVGMALRSSGADNAFGIWNEWSQIGPKYNAGIMRAKWVSFLDKPNGVTLATIFKLAQDRGWVNPATREAQAFEAVTGVTLEEANRRHPEPVLLPDAAVEWRAFPAPGLDEVAAWIDSGASVVYPAATRQAVLAIVSAATSRLYVTPQGDPLSLYLGCCGRSVGELRYAHHAVAKALSDAGLRRIVRSSRMSSPATIYKTLLRSPTSVYLSDDYGGVASFSKRQPSGLQEHALSLISGIYDGKTIQLEGPEDAGLRAGSGQVSDEQPVIYAPCLSILALIGTDQLATLFRQSETGRGALQQMLLAIGDERTAIEQDPQDLPPPAWLASYLRQLRRAPSAEPGADLNLADIFGSLSGLAPQQIVVQFSASPGDVYAALDSISSERRVRSLLLAARGIVRRIAGGLAAWANPAGPVVTADIMDWAGAYVVDRMRETVEQFEILNSTDGKSSVYDQVLARIVEAKSTGMSPRDLTISCWGFRSLSGEKRGELIDLLLSDEMIKEISVLNPKTKRRSKVFVGARFVEPEGEQ